MREQGSGYLSRPDAERSPTSSSSSSTRASSDEGGRQASIESFRWRKVVEGKVEGVVDPAKKAVGGAVEKVADAAETVADNGGGRGRAAAL